MQGLVARGLTREEIWNRRTNGQTSGKAGTYVAKSGGQGDVSYKV